MTKRLNFSKYNEVVFENKKVDERLSELTKEEKFYSKVYEGRNLEEKENDEAFLKQKTELEEKKAKIRDSMFKHTKVEMELDKKIYNRQLVFLQLEKIYRDKCSENKIYEPLNIKNLSGQDTIEWEKVLNQREIEKKVQNDFNRKLTLINQINSCIKRQIDEFRRVDRDLQQDSEKIKNCSYHFSKHGEKVRENSRKVSSSIEKMKLEKLFRKVKKVKKRKGKFMRSLDQSKSHKVRRVYSGRTPNGIRKYYTPKNPKGGRFSARHKRVRSDGVSFPSRVESVKQDSTFKHRRNRSDQVSMSGSFRVIKIRKRKNSKGRNISPMRQRMQKQIRNSSKESLSIIDKFKDIRIPSIEAFSRKSKDMSIGDQEILSSLVNRRKNRAQPILIREVSKEVKNGKKVTVPGINIIPPSKRGSIRNNMVRDLSSYSILKTPRQLSSDEKIEEEKGEESNKGDEEENIEEFDLRKLMNQIKKEDDALDSHRESKLDITNTSLDESLLDKSKISEMSMKKREGSSNEKILNPSSFKPKDDSKGNLSSRKSSKRPSKISSKRRIGTFPRPLIIIEENTNEFSISKNSPISRIRRNRKGQSSPNVSNMKKRTLPTLPMLSAASSPSNDSLKREFNRRASVRFNEKEMPSLEKFNERISPSKRFADGSSLEENVSNSSIKRKRPKGNNGKFTKKLNNAMLGVGRSKPLSESQIDDINRTQSLNKPRSIIKNSAFYTPKNASHASNSTGKNRKRLSVRFSEDSMRMILSGKKKKAPSINSIFKEDEENSDSKTGSSRSRKKDKTKSAFYKSQKKSDSHKSGTLLNIESPMKNNRIGFTRRRSDKKASMISIRSKAFDDFEVEDQDFYHPREYQGDPNEKMKKNVTALF